MTYIFVALFVQGLKYLRNVYHYLSALGSTALGSTALGKLLIFLR